MASSARDAALQQLTPSDDHAASATPVVLASEQLLLTPADTKIHELTVPNPTSGFVPINRRTKLPSEFQALDEYATQVPTYIREGSERDKISQLPHDMADHVDGLPEECLAKVLRIAGDAAHLWYYNQKLGDEKTDPLPEHLEKFWIKLNERAGRPFLLPDKRKALRTHYDVFLSNAVAKVPLHPDTNWKITLDDLELSEAVFGNNEERVFSLTFAVMELRFSSAFPWIFKALRAVAEKNETALIEALQKITFVLERVTEAFDYISPNPNSKNYVDQSVWTKTIAYFDSPIPNGQPGTSGTMLGLFLMLDTLMERRDFDSAMGKALFEKFKAQPKRVETFLHAFRGDMEKHSISQFVSRSENPTLQSTYQSLREAYIGPHGLMKVHMDMVYSFMIINLDEGRKTTNGGNAGTSKKQPPHQRNIYLSLKAPVEERSRAHTHFVQFAGRVKTQVLGGNATEVVLDTKCLGMSFLPGDRCEIFPQNSAKIVAQFIRCHGLTADAVVTLSPEWIAFLKTEWNLDAEKLTAKEFLQYADLQNVKQGTKAAAIDLSQMKPLKARLYSVSPLYDSEHCGRISLTVGGHCFVDSLGEYEGAASTYLTKGTGPVRITKAATRHFHLPDEPKTPVIMFAAGTGISPFMGFIGARMQAESGPNLLFFSTTCEDTFYHRDKLQRAAQQGLDLAVIFSRDKKADTVCFDHKQRQLVCSKKYSGTQKPHIDLLIQERAEQLAKLIAEDGAHIYVCGNSGFEESVRNALDEALKARIPDAATRRAYLHTLGADRRYNLDIFTPPKQAGHEEKQRQIFSSELALHNKKDDMWIAFNGKVYNFNKPQYTSPNGKVLTATDFRHLHPGGLKVFQVVAGSDGSEGYNDIAHNKSPQVEAFLARYYEAELATPVFAQAKNAELYNRCNEFLRAILKVQNTLLNSTNFPTKNPAPYLWREVFAVLMEGRMSGYQNAEGGPFTSTFGTMFNNLCNVVGFPKTDLEPIFRDLVHYANECGMSLKILSTGHLSPQALAAVEKRFKELLEHTFTFIDSMKAEMIAILRNLEQNGDNFDPNCLPKGMQACQQHMKDFLSYLKALHKGIAPPKSHPGHASLFAIAQPPCEAGRRMLLERSTVPARSPAQAYGKEAGAIAGTILSGGAAPSHGKSSCSGFFTKRRVLVGAGAIAGTILSGGTAPLVMAGATALGGALGLATDAATDKLSKGCRHRKTA